MLLTNGITGAASRRRRRGVGGLFLLIWRVFRRVLRNARVLGLSLSSATSS